MKVDKKNFLGEILWRFQYVNLGFLYSIFLSVSSLPTFPFFIFAHTCFYVLRKSQKEISATYVVLN